MYAGLRYNLVDHADGVSKFDLFLALLKFCSHERSSATEKLSLAQKMDKELNIINTKKTYKTLQSSIMGFLLSFVKNDEIRSSISCQIVLERTRGKKSTQFLKGTTRELF